MSKLEFYPYLTPTDILKNGAFGGSYFGVEELEGDYDYQSLFEETLSSVSPHLYLGNKYKPKMNLFKIRSGMNYDYWTEMNWMHKDDPYGWFEWYLKYYNGRRHPDDDRQIRRWQDFCGINGRWRKRIYSRIYETNDWQISPRIQQSLLHWGYMVNKEDYVQWKYLNNKL
jgi:hypothetical protein